MNVIKKAQGGQSSALEQGDLERIGALARKPLKEEEIYTFSVRLSTTRSTGTVSALPLRRWKNWRSFLWAKAAFLTTSGRPGGRLPESIRLK